MKFTLTALVLTGLLATPALGRLGENRDQVLARYGKPTETVHLASVESLHFKKGECTVYVELSHKTGLAVQIYYFKDTPFTPAQVAELLSRNAEGKLWAQDPYNMLAAKRSDGGLARGAIQKNADGSARYMLAILSKSADTLDKSPADEAGEAAAKEIEGL